MKGLTRNEVVDQFLRVLIEAGWTPDRLIKRYTELRYEYLRQLDKTPSKRLSCASWRDEPTDASFIAKVDDKSTTDKAPRLPNDTMA